ncbi:MAG TPA: hypothetical protein VFR09_04030 [Alphaproteobacteria bacterium]|nr:hypothetical protein [Alphaproteobacteria bacterium]
MVICVTSNARADTSSNWGSGRVLQEALSSSDHRSIYSGTGSSSGFAVSSSLFSGRASGVDTNSYMNNGINSGDTATLEGDGHVYAMMVDGRYQFHDDFGTGLGFHPYMSGGVGMAMYEMGGSSTSYGIQSGDMVPMVRVGGGVAYDLSETMKMSLDYKAGFSSGEPALGMQSVDMQSINMGWHYKF